MPTLDMDIATPVSATEWEYVNPGNGGSTNQWFSRKFYDANGTYLGEGRVYPWTNAYAYKVNIAAFDATGKVVYDELYNSRSPRGPLVDLYRCFNFRDDKQYPDMNMFN